MAIIAVVMCLRIRSCASTSTGIMALTCAQLEALLCMVSQCATEGDFIVFYTEKASPLRCEARGDFDLLSEGKNVDSGQLK